MRGGRGGRGGRVANQAQLRSTVLSHKTNAVRRLHKDLKEIRDQEVPLVGVTACPLDDSVFVWHGNLRAPSDSVYAGGVFHLEINFPQNYPVAPPGLTFFGFQMSHPNVFGSKLCLDMLENNKGGRWYEGWNSAYTVEAILIQLQSFLFDKPKLKKGEVKEEMEEKYKETVDQANSYKCSKCKHRGPIEPYPPFNEKETDISAFCILRDPKQMLQDEMLCFHSRTTLAEQTLGIGVSLQRLPRTGEIRSVTPSLDLLCLRAFQKQNVRKSIDGDKFTHWLPLYFGNNKPYERKTQTYNEEKKEYVNKVENINPKERMIHLLKKSLSFLTKKDTRKEMTAEMIVEVMPKLMITHLVDLVGEKHHISLVAIRRLFNFIRLFRLLMELIPESQTIVNEKLQQFKDHPDKRDKDHCSSLGDILSFAIVSNKFDMEDLLDSYLDEQLDRQAFWIIKQIPELDHTDEKYKGKEIILEESRNEVCFKTGLVGFNITMVFYTINSLIKDSFKSDLGSLSAALDDNFGCLPTDLENKLQVTMKSIKKVDNFNKYYQWVKRSCPNAQALSIRLRIAIENSKAKRYHGSSEHMNILPTMEVQATTQILADPSPFIHFDEEKATFNKDAKDPLWKDAVLKKFEWVKVHMKSHLVEDTPSAVADESDRQYMCGRQELHHEQILASHHVDLRSQKWRKSKILAETLNTDYPVETFTWRHLFHKLCFEQMISELAITTDFKLMYKYIQTLGKEIECLRIQTIDKTHLKSNQYWLMALISKMPSLKVIKFHKPKGGKLLNKDGYKFLLKGLTYMQANGRDLVKFQMNNLLGSDSAEYLYPCLKLHQNLMVMKFNDLTLSNADAKAIGRVLADFKNVRELDLTNCKLNTTSTKDIADGLMRAKQLEMIKVGTNPDMGKSVNAIIYNLAFSPKIRFIDLEAMKGTDTETAEALYKLINISGSIETLNLYHADINVKLTEEFWKAIGQNKTLKYLNISLYTQAPPMPHAVAKAVAMNCKKQGSLKALSMENWFIAKSRLDNFLEGLKITEQDHEYWYGDRNMASKMTKEDVYEKVQYFGLEYLNIGGARSNLSGQSFKPKQILAQVKPEWPEFIKLAANTKDLILDMDQVKFSYRDMEFLAYAIGENPIGPCKFVNLNLKKSLIQKEGTKFLAPALAINKSIMQLDLSSCKLGVSGTYRIAEALKTNSVLKSLNLYRNIIDVDGARSIGKMLQVNKTLEFLDIGHNRIRQTGLKAICDGILTNPDCKLSKLSICSNFINDDGFTTLFEKLILPSYSGRKQQLTHLYIKKNFMSEYNKISLANKVSEKGVKVFVDDFRAVDYLVKERLEKSIWVSPVEAIETIQGIKNILYANEVGFVTDIRISQGRTAPGRPKGNIYATVEFADSNSIARSLQMASKGKAIFSGTKVRIYKSGTQTAILQPQQKRR